MSDLRKVTVDLILPEVTFITSRSGGPGGQNVNKVSSKVTLNFDVPNSRLLTDDEKQFVLLKLGSRITAQGLIQVTSQESRSQQQNRETVIVKLNRLLEKMYEVRKPRKATKPSKAAKEKRIKEKRQRSERKQWRQKPE